MARLEWLLQIALVASVVLHSSTPAPQTNHRGEAVEDYHEDANADSYEYEDETESSKTDGAEDNEATITTHAMTVEADVGGEFQLLCHGNSGAYVKMWEKGQELLFVGGLSQTSDSRISIQDDSSRLIVKNVSAKDSGKFKCRFSTPTPVQVVHTVHVRVPPTAKVMSPVQVLTQGDSAAFMCEVSGYPTPSVFWERKKKRMPGGEERVEGALVTLADVTRHHAGIYECVAENALGSARTALDLQVRYAPEVEVEKESVNTGQGLDADLVCLIHAEPKASVVWYKNGQLINERALGHQGHELVEHVSHRYILHLKNVKEEDFGRYQCAASNRLGRSNKSILLSGAPSQPIVESGKSGASGVGRDGVSYKLVWLLESTIPVHKYKLKFRKSDDEWTEVEVEGSEVAPHVFMATHTLDNLSPSTDYQASLQAENEYGWSPQSHVHNFHTHEMTLGDAVESGAEAVESTASSAGSVAVSFPVFFLLLSAIFAPSRC